MAEYYINTITGSGANDGSIGSPWGSWDDFESDNPAGSHTIHLEGGVENITMVLPSAVTGIIIEVDDDGYQVNRSSSSYGAAATLDDVDITVTGNGYGLKITQSASGGRRALDVHPESGNTFDCNGLILKNAGGGSNQTALNLYGAGTHKLRNAVIVDSELDGISVSWSNGAPTAYVHNCTILNCDDDGIARVSGTIHARNNVCMNCVGDDYSGFFSTKENCASEDATGTTGHTGLTPADEMDDPSDVTIAGQGWKLKSTSNLIEEGSDLDADANNPVTDDFFGNARDASTPDIGADEFQSSSTPTDTVGSSDGAATAQANTANIFGSPGASTSSASVTGNSGALAAAEGASFGSSVNSFVAQSIFASVLTAAAVSAVNGISQSFVASVAESNSLSTVLGVSEVVAAGVGTSSGVGAVSGVSAAIIESVANAAGTSAVSGVGEDAQGNAVEGVGQSDGVATVLGEAAWYFGSVGEANGVAVAGANSGSTVGSEFSSDGVASVSGEGQDAQSPYFETVGNAAGSSVVTGNSGAIVSIVAESDSASTVLGEAAMVFNLVGTSAGASVVSGLSAALWAGEANSAGIATANFNSNSVGAGVFLSSSATSITFNSSAIVKSEFTIAGLVSMDWRSENAAVPDIVLAVCLEGEIIMRWDGSGEIKSTIDLEGPLPDC